MFCVSYFRTNVFKDLIVMAVGSHFNETTLHGGEYVAVMVDTRNTHRNLVRNLMGKFSLGEVGRKCDIFTDAGSEAVSRTALMWSASNRLFPLLDTRLVRSVLFYQSRPLIDVMQVSKQKVSRRASYKVAVSKLNREMRTALLAALSHHFSISNLIL